jgi:hypothetical protein
MSMMHDMKPPGVPDAVASLLDSLRAGLANARPELRATALRPLQGPGLRAAMLLNPRLNDRINKRLASQNGWNLPDEITPFPEAENVIHLLTTGPENCCTDIGLAWHANTLSRIVMRGGAQLQAQTDPQRLRRALSLRHPDAPVGTELPPAEVLQRDGVLCLMAWADSLPATIAPTVFAVLINDHRVFDLHPIGPQGGQLAASIASGWLAADRGGRP